MTRNTFLFSAVCALGLLGGCDDLGDCTDPAQGRVPVLVGTDVMYAGQAIMVQSCAANGVCHNANASRAQRYGAPAGLDFDVKPVTLSGAGDAGVGELGEDDLGRLRKHQRKVFDTRHDIWQQVDRGLMPPDGAGAQWRNAKPGSLIDVSGGGCPVTKEIAPITDSETKKLLRDWLACGSPIVEANVPDLQKPVGGTVGDQFPACGAPEDATFDTLFSAVLEPNCVACHAPDGLPVAKDFDLSTPEAAYANLMGKDGKGRVPSGCESNSNFMVTPGVPEKSYIYAVVGGKGAGTVCADLMPLGTLGLDPVPLDVLKRWIESGAPGPGQAAGDAGAADGGSDMTDMSDMDGGV